jgi:hypothetical protein
MEIKAYKNYSEIVNLLDSIKERLETEFENFQEEFTQKYNLEITPELMQALTEFIKLKLDFTFKNFIKDFNWLNIIVDCSDIDFNMNEIEALLRRVNREMKDRIPEEAEPREVQIILKKYLRRVICRIPTSWTQPVVSDFLKQFLDTLNQLGIETA